MAIALEQGVLHSLANLIWLGLPGTQTDGGNLVAGIKGEDFPMRHRVM